MPRTLRTVLGLPSSWIASAERQIWRATRGAARLTEASFLAEMGDSTRRLFVLAAIRATSLSVAWAILVGGAAVVSGVAAHSLGLVGFGLNSLIDGSASAVLIWRFRVEQRDPDRAHRVEHAAHGVVGMTMMVVAAYIGVQAIRSLITRAEPRNSTAGVVIAAASLLVLPFLAVVKLRLARQLRSGALRGDGLLTTAGAILAFAVLASLALNNAFEWWWSDAIVAVLIAAFLGGEGWRSRSMSTDAA
jgi:divalent metal cation (Fe/Co/Zn/Cd) transporter